MNRRDLYDPDMAALAAAWMAELRIGSDEAPVAMQVTMMNFLAPPADQWAFLLAAVDLAESDDELCEIAVGPFEHLLGFHGEAYIDLVESVAAGDPKFARMTKDSWRHLMSDDVWRRVQAIQKKAGG